MVKNMSKTLLKRILNLKIDCQAKMVLLIVVINAKGNYSCISLNDIARQAMMAKSTIIRKLAVLKDLELVFVEKRSSDKQCLTSVYYINPTI
jgi:hypothetical protein